MLDRRAFFTRGIISGKCQELGIQISHVCEVFHLGDLAKRAYFPQAILMSSTQYSFKELAVPGHSPDYLSAHYRPNVPILEKVGRMQTSGEVEEAGLKDMRGQ